MMILDVLRLEEKVKKYENDPVVKSKDSEKLANAGAAGEVGKLKKAIEAKDRDLATLKKQCEGLQREYNELSDRYNAASGSAEPTPRKDR